MRDNYHFVALLQRGIRLGQNKFVIAIEKDNFTVFRHLQLRQQARIFFPRHKRVLPGESVVVASGPVVARDEADLDGLESAYLSFFSDVVLPPKSVLIPVPNQLGYLRRLADTLRPNLVILSGGNNIDPKNCVFFV